MAGQGIGGDTERATDLPDPGFGERAGHIIENVGIEHRVTTTHKPKIAIETTVRHRPIGDQRCPEAVARAQAVEPVGRGDRLCHAGRWHGIERVEHLQHLAGAGIRDGTPDPARQSGVGDDVRQRCNGSPDQIG
jgi:hypothetical protein